MDSLTGTWDQRCGAAEEGGVDTHGVQVVQVGREGHGVQEEGLEGRLASPLAEQVPSEVGTGNCGILRERSAQGSARCSPGLALLAAGGGALLGPWVRVGRRAPQPARHPGYRSCVSRTSTTNEAANGVNKTKDQQKYKKR